MRLYASPPEALSGVYAKLDRARIHLAELKRELTPLINPDPYDIRRVQGDDPCKYVYRAHAAPGLPRHIGPIVGDVLHNLASALDHLAGRLVVASGGVPDGSTSYPIHLTRPKRGIKISPVISDEILGTVDNFQPYGLGKWIGDYLFLIQQLNEFDKHNDMLLIVAALRFTWHGVPHGSEGPAGSRAFNDPLLPGLVVAELIFDAEPNYEPDLNLELEVRLAPTPELARRLKSRASGVFAPDLHNLLVTLTQHLDSLLWQFWRVFPQA